MQNQNMLLSFLIELVNRLKTKKPKFFIYLQWITGALGAVTGLPELLTSWGIVLPSATLVLENKIVAACSIGFFIASQLTSASPVAAVTKDGAVLKQTDSKDLPFTAQTEVKKAQDAQVPNTAVTLAQVKEVK